MKVIASLTLSGTDSRSLALADGRITVVKPALCAPSTLKRNWGKKVVCWIFHLVPNSSHRKHKAMQRDLPGHCLDCPRWANKKSDQPDPCEQDVRWGGWPGWWRWSLLHSVHPGKETSQLWSLVNYTMNRKPSPQHQQENEDGCHCQWQYCSPPAPATWSGSWTEF